MEENKIKIEIILNDTGFSMVAESSGEMNLLERIGLSQILQRDLPGILKHNPDLVLGDEIVENYSKRDEQENGEIPDKVLKALEAVLGRNSNTSCDCIICQIKEFKKDPFNLSKDDAIELKEIAVQKEVPVEKILDSLKTYYSESKADSGKVINFNQPTAEA